LFEGMQTEEEKKQVDSSIQKFPQLIRVMFENLRDEKRNCDCGEALRRYRNKGFIPPN